MARARPRRAVQRLRHALLSALAAWGALDEVADGDEVASGVRLVAAPGHRSGHACVLVGDELVHLADVVHHPAHVAHPEWDPAFDADAETALITRRRWLASTADSGVRVVHAHVAGAGRVVRDGPGFAWIAEGVGAA